MLQISVRRCRACPPDAPLGHEPDSVEADPTRTAFLLVDVYLPPAELGPETLSGADYQAKERIIAERIAPALVAARKTGLAIVYVANSAPRIALERSAFGRHLETVGTDLAGEFAEENVDPLEYHSGPVSCLSYPEAIAPRRGDHYVRKHVYSGFYATRLEPLLRNLGTETLIAVGHRLDGCLGSTLMEALFRNFQAILLRDCTLACDLPDEQPSRSFTKRMVLWYEMMIGPTSTSSDFVTACRQARRTSWCPSQDSAHNG